MRGEKFLRSIRLEPRHAAGGEGRAELRTAIRSAQMSEHRKRYMIDEESACLARSLKGRQQHRSQMNRDRINDSRAAGKMRDAPSSGLLRKVVQDAPRHIKDQCLVRTGDMS